MAGTVTRLRGERHRVRASDLIALAAKSRSSAQQLLVEAEDRARRSLERRLCRSRLGKSKSMADFDWAWRMHGEPDRRKTLASKVAVLTVAAFAAVQPPAAPVTGAFNRADWLFSKTDAPSPNRNVELGTEHPDAYDAGCFNA